MTLSLTPVHSAVLLAALVLGTGAAQAQPNWRAEPMFGTVNLSAGFAPDPHTVTVRAGGRDRNSISGSGCAGYINNAQPDVDLNYEAGRSRLYIYVKSDDDTTLLVNTPTNDWYCSDDFEGSNPAIILNNPSTGNYNIWVGTYDAEGDSPEATIYISELAPRW